MCGSIRAMGLTVNIQEVGGGASFDVQFTTVSQRTTALELVNAHRGRIKIETPGTKSFRGIFHTVGDWSRAELEERFSKIRRNRNTAMKMGAISPSIWPR